MSKPEAVIAAAADWPGASLERPGALRLEARGVELQIRTDFDPRFSSFFLTAQAPFLGQASFVLRRKAGLVHYLPIPFRAQLPERFGEDFVAYGRLPPGLGEGFQAFLAESALRFEIHALDETLLVHLLLREMVPDAARLRVVVDEVLDLYDRLRDEAGWPR